MRIIYRRFQIKTPFTLLRYAHVRYVKSMFTNIQKQQNMLKISLLSPTYNPRILGIKNAAFSGYCFYYEQKQIGLRKCTFNQMIIKILSKEKILGPVSFYLTLKCLKKCY